MPQTCKVCIHPNRAAIDDELSRDWERSLRSIGNEYGLTKDSLSRHAQRHLQQEPGALSLAVTEKEPDEARQVLQGVEQKKEPEEPASLDEQFARFWEMSGRRA